MMALARFQPASDGPVEVTKQTRSMTTVRTPTRVSRLLAASSDSDPRFWEVCDEPISIRRAGRCTRPQNYRRRSHPLRVDSGGLAMLGYLPLCDEDFKFIPTELRKRSRSFSRRSKSWICEKKTPTTPVSRSAQTSVPLDPQ